MQKTKSSIYLIIVNIIPIIGVGLFNWSLYEILLIYWLENIVIGFYTVLKIAMTQGVYKMAGGSTSQGAAFKTFLIPFFIVHFGGFTLGHGAFVYGLFGPPSPFYPGELTSIWPLFITFGLFMASHGISFYQNFVQNKEYQKVSTIQMMFSPYGRVSVMHLIVMASGFIFALLGANIFTKTAIIVIKTLMDYRLHSREHTLVRRYKRWQEHAGKPRTKGKTLGYMVVDAKDPNAKPAFMKSMPKSRKNFEKSKKTKIIH